MWQPAHRKGRWQLGEMHIITPEAPVGRGLYFERGGHMMIVVSRSGALIRQDELTQEQRDELWLRVFSAYLQLHPEEITGGQDAAEVSTASA